MRVKVEVTSDVICPWCFIGKRRLEKAVAACRGERDVRVRWHPFQLNPHMPKDGMNRKEYRTAKFGSWERSLGLDAQVTAAGLEEGITFAFDKIIQTRMARLNVNGNSEALCVNPRFPRLAGVYT